MTRIDKARKRLARAVERLEGARRAQSGRLAELKEALTAAQGAGPDAGDIGDLVQALEEAQRENAALVAERDAMADRVDAIIGKVRSVAGMNDNERAGSGL
ncbi:MAG: hypothetical protein OXC10_08145 [Rhodospirillaceae bacterium]|nr:hypothetical protein [Rhodospirillaceae bacterium]